MKAYVRQAECGSDTLVGVPHWFDAVFPTSASDWLQSSEKPFFMEELLFVVKFSKEEDAEEMVSLWNNRN